ncbi:Amino acid kinase family protein, partial [Zea mays]
MAKEVAQEQPRPTAPRTVRCIVKLGSFGHFQASRSGVHKGGLHSTLVKAGFVATRISVTSLNQEIVRALAREGIPSVGMSSFACGWSTHQRKVSKLENCCFLAYHSVLHGDAVLDELLDCTILSGDVIITNLAQLLSPKYVVFWYCYLSSFTALKVFCYQWKMVLYTITVFFNCLYRLPWDTENVHGVYDRPPTDSNAVLLRGI